MVPSRRSFTVQFNPKILKYISDNGCLNAAAGIFELMKQTYGGKPNQISSIRVVKNGLLKTKQLSGRSPLSEDLDELVYQWIITKR